MPEEIARGVLGFNISLGIIALAMGISLQQVDAQQEERNATQELMDAADNVINSIKNNGNETESLSLSQDMNTSNATSSADRIDEEANRLIAEAQQKVNEGVSHRNCVQMFVKDSFVQLVTSENCDGAQLAKAVIWYKTNGYPIESAYTNMGSFMMVQLDTVKFNQATK